MTIKRTYKSRSVDPHDWDRVSDVRGIITAMGSLEVDDENRRYLIIDLEEGRAQVFHSHGLDEAFNLATVGDHIHIEYHGKTKTKKLGRSFNKFSVQLWTESEEDDEIGSEAETL